MTAEGVDRGNTPGREGCSRHGHPEGVGTPDTLTLRGANGESGQGLNQVEALHGLEPHVEVSGDPLKTSTDGITYPDGEVIAPVDWKARLAAVLELASRKKASRRTERQQFARARQYGLTRRRAAKLARLKGDNVSLLNRGDKPTVDPTVAQRAMVEAEEQASEACSTAMDVERADGTDGAASIPPIPRSTRRSTTRVPQRCNGDRQ